MNRITFFIVFGLFIQLGFGQEQKTIVIEKESQISATSDNASDYEKEISIDVSLNDNNEREVSITVTKDGDTEKIEWKDSGEIPAEIKKLLDEKGIDVQMLGGGKEKTMMFIGDDQLIKKKKRIMIMDSDNDGEEMEIEWDGEGEMPAEMKKMLDENDIDISEMSKGKEGKKVKMKVIKRAEHSEGPHGPHRKMKFKKGGKDFTWMEKGERGMKKRHRESKVYMGVQISSDEDGRVKVEDVMVDSPAHKAGLKKGDRIKEINGANTRSMDDLLTILSFYDVNDTVTVDYVRGNKSKSAKVKLTAKPEAYR